jgi:transcriptional regulator with PAS, ATPase and Fis domain
MDKPGEFTLADLPQNIQENYIFSTARKSMTPSMIRKNNEGLLQKTEDLVIDMVLKETGYSINKAAQLLGVCKQTLYNRLKYNSK